jgi:hypothetical protein
MEQDDDPHETIDSGHREVPGGPAATPATPEGRDAALEEGEEA